MAGQEPPAGAGARSEIILGLSAYYHDSAAALLVDGRLVAAAQEERFSRKRHDAGFPAQAVRYVLQEAGLELADVTRVAFYDKPLVKFERLLETYHMFAPRGLRSFFSAMPVWIKEKLFLKRMLREGLDAIQSGRYEFSFPEHHLSHAASAFFPSPFEEAAILTIDGVGEWTTTSISHGRGNSIETLKEIRFPHSLGLLYSAFTYYCGFKVNSGEYKLMGLAPYGEAGAEETKRFVSLIRENLIDIRDDGSFVLNLEYFDYPTGLTMTEDARWQALFGLPRRSADGALSQAYMNLALAIQQVTEEVVCRLARTALAETGSGNLALAGGVALNCVANGRLLRDGVVRSLWIQPAAGDAGGAVGAALAQWHIGMDRPRTPSLPDGMSNAYLGPAFGERDIERLRLRHGAVGRREPDRKSLCRLTSEHLADGAVVGWFQGRMEFGPRALCNRSIIGDARNPEMQKKINLKTKFREGFRPFAPVVLESESRRFFDLDQPSPYMLLVAPVVDGIRKPLPSDYAQRELYERLYFQRSTLPAVTHVDFSARLQTVTREANPVFAELLEQFAGLTGTPVLINTSFNVRGEPIVCTPEDAYRCFMQTEMDVLVIEDYLFLKADQPAWTGPVNAFAPD